MIVRDGRLFWGMDSPVETCFVCTIGRETPHQPVELCELPGPTYYMTQNKAGGIYLGTTVEPGPSVKDNYGHVFGLRPDNSWREILRRKNDIMPQFGIFYFPKGVLPAKYTLKPFAISAFSSSLNPKRSRLPLSLWISIFFINR